MALYKSCLIIIIIVLNVPQPDVTLIVTERQSAVELGGIRITQDSRQQLVVF